MLANDCKVWQNDRYERRTVGVQPSDWSWGCDSIGALEGSVFNKTGEYVIKIIITGTKSKKAVGKQIQSYSFAPNTSYDFYFFPGNGICNVDKSARMQLEYSVTIPGFCKTRYTKSELEIKRRKEIEERQQQAEQDILYNNCVIAKSKGIDSSAVSSVRSVCREISKNPTTWQKLKWGS